ncbi:aspartate/glutamate racemase family protein [Marinobacter gelidimuriae]|uniref:aspartate/glutamate racemase family protein n=1 Tax=Marinobacter gelidimuriae TaxID=2739064 RepID=UPI00035DD71A|nr:aspartate/glutamate racemase family protein [Marinobacter gelidimuriae]
MHIGMIGGIGPAATEFYYRNLVRASQLSGNATDLELTICHAHASDLIRNIQSNAVSEQVKIFEVLANRLKAAGADALVVTSIAGHFCISELAKVSPIPIIDALSGLESELVKSGYGKVGVLGNKVVMETRLFNSLQNTDVVIPPDEHLDEVHEAYMSIAVSGTATKEQRNTIFQAGQKMCDDQGAQAIVLAGTDLFVAFDGYDCGFRYIDSALVHIADIHHASLSKSDNKAMHATSA